MQNTFVGSDEDGILPSETWRLFRVLRVLTSTRILNIKIRCRQFNVKFGRRDISERGLGSDYYFVRVFIVFYILLSAWFAFTLGQVFIFYVFLFLVNIQVDAPNNLLGFLVDYLKATNLGQEFFFGI